MTLDLDNIQPIIVVMMVETMIQSEVFEHFFRALATFLFRIIAMGHGRVCD